MSMLHYHDHQVRRLYVVEDVGHTVWNCRCYAQEHHWQDVLLWWMSWHTFMFHHSLEARGVVLWQGQGFPLFLHGIYGHVS